MFKSPVLPISYTKRYEISSMGSLHASSMPGSRSSCSVSKNHFPVQDPRIQIQCDQGLSGTPRVTWKTIPCWHFVKRTECPHGDSCAFVHDLNLHEVLERDRQAEKKTTGIQKTSHCWAYIQGRCYKRNCCYLHPADIKPYIPYTPCPNWSSCGPIYCPFQHPVSHRHLGNTKQEREKMEQSVYFETLATVSGKAIEHCGTTYFPLFYTNKTRDPAAIGVFARALGNGYIPGSVLNSGFARNPISSMKSVNQTFQCLKRDGSAGYIRVRTVGKTQQQII